MTKKLIEQVKQQLQLHRLEQPQRLTGFIWRADELSLTSQSQRSTQCLGWQQLLVTSLFSAQIRSVWPGFPRFPWMFSLLVHCSLVLQVAVYEPARVLLLLPDKFRPLVFLTPLLLQVINVIIGEAVGENRASSAPTGSPREILGIRGILLGSGQRHTPTSTHTHFL